jgi:sulfur relay protein TusB/DsrH
LVTGSPYSSDALQSCCYALAATGDATLLLQDAVYWANQPTDLLPMPCFILEADALARGIHQIPACMTKVDYSGWVHLVEQSRKTCTW